MSNSKAKRLGYFGVGFFFWVCNLFRNFFRLESFFCKCEWHPVAQHVLTFFFILQNAFIKAKGCSGCWVDLTVLMATVGHFFMYHSIVGWGLSSVTKTIWYENILYVYFYFVFLSAVCSNRKPKVRCGRDDCMSGWSIGFFGCFLGALRSKMGGGNHHNNSAQTWAWQWKTRTNTSLFFILL